MIYTYKILANITYWAVRLLTAGFVKTVLAWRRKLSPKGDISVNITQWTTKMKGNSVKDSRISLSNSKHKFQLTQISRTSRSLMGRLQAWQRKHSACQIASMQRKIFPGLISVLQPAQILQEILSNKHVRFHLLYKMQQIQIKWRSH